MNIKWRHLKDTKLFFRLHSSSFSADTAPFKKNFFRSLSSLQMCFYHRFNAFIIHHFHIQKNARASPIRENYHRMLVLPESYDSKKKFSGAIMVPPINSPSLACVPFFACIKCLIRFPNDFFALLWTTIREVSWIRRGRRRWRKSKADIKCEVVTNKCRSHWELKQR